MSEDSTTQCLLFPGIFRKPVVAQFDPVSYTHLDVYKRQGPHRLVEALYHRRAAIRGLIEQLRELTRDPFPNWRESPA